MCDYCGCRDLPPIGELMDEHDSIMELAWKVAERTTPDDASWQEARDELRAFLLRHATKEEIALYPLLTTSGDLNDDDRELLEEEHRSLLALIDGGAFDRKGLNELSAHIQEEELELFPGAMFAFTDDDWGEMERARHDVFHRLGIPHGEHGHEHAGGQADPGVSSGQILDGSFSADQHGGIAENRQPVDRHEDPVDFDVDLDTWSSVR